MATHVFNTRKILILSLLMVGLMPLFSQNVAISDDDSYVADTKAMLDVKSTTKGMLVPRVALVSTTNPIADTKPNGLLVWNTLAGTYSVGYYFWNGTTIILPSC